MAWTRRLPSGRYQGLYRDAAGRVRRASESEGGGTYLRQGDAKAAAEDQESKIRRGLWVDPQLSRTTVEARAAVWLAGARHTLKPKTIASYESLLRSRVLPAFGSRHLRAIKPSDITAWVGSMVSDGLSPSRIRQAHVILRLVLDSAVGDGYIARNPAVGIKLPKLEHREAPFFEPGVVDDLVDAGGRRYSGLVGHLDAEPDAHTALIVTLVV